MEDSVGEVGVRLSKELMSVAGEGLKANVTTLGPLVCILMCVAAAIVRVTVVAVAAAVDMCGRDPA